MENKKDITKIYTGQQVHAAFQITRMNTFEINYKFVGNNEYPDFCTSAIIWARNKRGYKECGQCQEKATKRHTIAYNFYKKWDKWHLKGLTETQFNELLDDIKQLEQTYNSIIKIGETPCNISFNELKCLSMMKPMNKEKTIV